MKIIEGKQAVLRPCQTERICVMPKRGQNAHVLEPMVCPVIELTPAKCISLERSDIPVQTPVDSVLRRISDTEMQKPVECTPQSVSDAAMRGTVDCIIRDISDFEATSSCTEIQAPVECIPQKVSERPLQPARAQVIPATPEWGQMLEENMSGRKKRKWLADTILHMTDSQ